MSRESRWCGRSGNGRREDRKFLDNGTRKKTLDSVKMLTELEMVYDEL